MNLDRIRPCSWDNTGNTCRFVQSSNSFRKYFSCKPCPIRRFDTCRQEKILDTACKVDRDMFFWAETMLYIFAQVVHKWSELYIFSGQKKLYILRFWRLVHIFLKTCTYLFLSIFYCCTYSLKTCTYFPKRKVFNFIECIHAYFCRDMFMS